MNIAVIFPVVAPPFLARAGGAASRAFAKVENREVFLRAVELYAKRDQVAQRLLVVVPDDLKTIQEKYANQLAFQGVSVSAGTSEWFGCVARALEKLDAAVDTVLIHDPCCPAVPFTLSDTLEETLTKNTRLAGVVPVLPTGNAFADVEAGGGGGVGGVGGINEYVEMSQVFQVQSPQIFRRQPLLDAYAQRAGKTFVDDAELVLSASQPVASVPGSRLNQRIDSDEMVRLAADLIEHLPKPKPKTPLSAFEEAQW
jgi:2-C-methyl-D-erythritol 4-phosphate cytidylyltransferase